MPNAAVENIQASYASSDEVQAIFEKRKAYLKPGLDYLKDK